MKKREEELRERIMILEKALNHNYFEQVITEIRIEIAGLKKQLERELGA